MNWRGDWSLPTMLTINVRGGEESDILSTRVGYGKECRISGRMEWERECERNVAKYFKERE